MFRVGEIVKVCRESAGLTQTQLAWKVDSSQSYISAIEKGKVCPTVDLYDRILDACGYELGYREKLND